MAICINKNSQEYQSLLKRTDITDDLLNALCRDFMDRYGRMPFLDELPGSDSFDDLKECINLNLDNTTTISNILDYTGEQSVLESIIKLNDAFRDLEISVIPVVEKAIVAVKHRPNKYNEIENDPVQLDKVISSPLVIGNILHKLSKLYGIKFNDITNAELALFKEIIPLDKSVNAFIYNGEVYINTDNAKVDAPIHEFMHILLGSLRFTNPNLYQLLISLSETLPNYDYLVDLYGNKSRNDSNEEIFVTEVSKYLTGQLSLIDALSESLKHEIEYSVTRVLDSILMGDISTGTIDLYTLSNMSLKELTLYVNSNIMSNNYMAQNSEYHRILNNMKADFKKQGILKEICE